jgi:hypothetical protein
MVSRGEGVIQREGSRFLGGLLASVLRDLLKKETGAKKTRCGHDNDDMSISDQAVSDLSRSCQNFVSLDQGRITNV